MSRMAQFSSGRLLRQMSFSHLFRAPLGVPFFILIFFLLFAGRASADDTVVIHPVTGSDFQATRDALVEVIEAEGMVVGSVLAFGQMLQRTADPQGSESPFRDAEIIQFCSAALARRMVDEDYGQIVFCPLSIAIYVAKAEPETIVMAYRSPGGESQAKIAAGKLLAKLVERAAGLAKFRW